MTEVEGRPAPAAGPNPAPVAAPASAAAKFKAVAPVAAGALAIVAAIAGGAIITGNSANPPTPSENAAIVNEAAPAPPAASDPAAAPLPQDPAASPPPVAAAPAPPAPSAAAPGAHPPKPGLSIPSVQFDQTPPAGVAQSMEIVVKFKDDAKIKDIVDAFWKDKSSARAKFDALKARRPEFANLKLDRVTYSNELVLVHDGGQVQLGAMRELAARLGKAADISYAEPNLTAHPGGQ